MLRRNLIANYLGQSWSGIMGLAFIPLYIQYLGIEAYGLIGLFAVLQTWLSLLDLGMSPTLGREMARFASGSHTPQSIGNLLRSLEVIVFSLASLITLSLYTGSTWLATDWLRSGELPIANVANALSVMSLVIGLRFCEGIYRSGILGLQHQVWFNGAHAALATLRHGGVVLVLAVVSPSIDAFFLWHGAVSLLTIGVYANKLHGLLPPAPSGAVFAVHALSDVWRFAGGMLGINLLAILLTQVDKVLLTHLLSLEHYGYFMLAATIAGGLNLLVAPVTQTFYPRLVELATRKDELGLASAYHQGAQLITLLTAPFLPILFRYPEGVIYLWTGNRELAVHTAPILAPLVLGTYLNCQMWLPSHCQLAHGWTSLGLKTNVVAVCFLVPAILMLVPIYGAVASAWLWVALNAGYILIGIHFMHRRILRGEKAQWYVRDVLKPTAGAVAVVFLLGEFASPGPQESRWVWLVFVAASATFALFSTALLSSRILPVFQCYIAGTRLNHGRQTQDRHDG